MANRNTRRRSLASQYKRGVVGAANPLLRELNKQEKALYAKNDPIYQYLTAKGALDTSGAINADYDAARAALTSDLAKVDTSSGAASAITSGLGAAIGVDASTVASLAAQSAVDPNVDAATRAALIADASTSFSQAKLGALQENRERSLEAQNAAVQRRSDLASERRGLALQAAQARGALRQATSPFATREAVRNELTSNLSYADTVQAFKKKYGRLPTRKELNTMNDNQTSGLRGGNTTVVPGVKPE